MGYTKSVRTAPPAHFKLKIGCFSLFFDSTCEIGRYESDSFEVGGYKWILYLYPRGYSQEDGMNYLSLYLAMAETQTLPPSWDVTVNATTFLYNHIDGDFLTVEDDKAWRFNELKTEWGIPGLISLIDLNDASRGFVSKDTFICGVEIYPVKHNDKGETLSLIKKPRGSTYYTWKISNFSAQSQKICSPEFSLGGHKLKIEIYPNGKLAEHSGHLSFDINSIDAKSMPPGAKVYIKYILRLKNQLGKNDFDTTHASHWFRPKSPSWGIRKMIPLSVLNDSSKGYLVNDSIITEVEIVAMTQRTLLS